MEETAGALILFSLGFVRFAMGEAGWEGGSWVVVVVVGGGVFSLVMVSMLTPDNPDEKKKRPCLIVLTSIAVC